MQPPKRDGAPHSATRRYVVHTDQSLSCSLVWQDGQWIVEKEGVGTPPVRLTLREFEASYTGVRLAPQLAEALRRAAEDA